MTTEEGRKGLHDADVQPGDSAHGGPDSAGNRERSGSGPVSPVDETASGSGAGPTAGDGTSDPSTDRGAAGIDAEGAASAAEPRGDVAAAAPEPTAPADEVPEIEDLDPEEQEIFDMVSEFIVAFLKTIRAAQFYVQGNPLLHNFTEDLGERLRSLWERIPVLSLSIFETEIRWRNRPVFRAEVGDQDNLAFQFYKDGIRRLEFHPGVEEEELIELVDVLRLAKRLKGDEDDLLTLIWNCDFAFVRYEYVDVLGDEPPMPEVKPSEGANTQLPTLPELEVRPEMEGPKLKEDFEPSLYFLNEKDLAHLQQELRREWERPLKKDVVKALLDQFEMGDIDRRYEVMEILRDMLPRILIDGDFEHAAYLLGQLNAIDGRKVDPDVTEQVEEIIAELSQPTVVEQLVRTLDDGSIEPESDELAMLLTSLKPDAIAILLQELPSVNRQEARDLIGETLDRLASMKPDMIRALIRSGDARVATESARIAGRLQIAEAAEEIAGLLEREDEEIRIAAVQALAALRSSMAGRPLLRALQADESRDVRVAAARGLADLGYKPAADDLAGIVDEKELWARDVTEQRAVFEAYARAAGEDAVKTLGRFLNGRRFLWFRYPSQTRACAARALGIVGDEEADRALAAAADVRDPVVRSAVQTAIRGPTDEREEGGRS